MQRLAVTILTGLALAFGSMATATCPPSDGPGRQTVTYPLKGWGTCTAAWTDTLDCGGTFGTQGGCSWGFEGWWEEWTGSAWKFASAIDSPAASTSNIITRLCGVSNLVEWDPCGSFYVNRAKTYCWRALLFSPPGTILPTYGYTGTLVWDVRTTFTIVSP